MDDRSLKVSMVGDGDVGKTCLWSVYVKNVFPSEHVFFKLKPFTIKSAPDILNWDHYSFRVEESNTFVELNGIVFNLNIWVTAKQDGNHHKLRSLFYANVTRQTPETNHTFEFTWWFAIPWIQTDAIILCYAVDNRSSFTNLTTKWIPELTKHCSNIPIVLVGNYPINLNSSILEILKKFNFFSTGTKLDTRKIEKRNDFSSNPNQISYSDGKKKKKEIGATSFVECSALDGTNVQVVFEEALQCAVGLCNKRRCAIL